MTRRLAVAAAVAISAGLLTQAQAAPTGAQFRYLESGDIAIRGADGARWVMHLAASQYTAGADTTPRLHISLARCAATKCTSKGTWSRPLQSAEVHVSADFTQGQLHTTLGGLALDTSIAHLGVPGPGHSPRGPLVIGPVPTGRTGLDQFYDATGAVHLGALRCEVTDGRLGQVTELDMGDVPEQTLPAPPKSLPAGFLTGKQAPRCN